MHFCANMVTEKEGVGHAILIRGVEPLNGMKMMMKNRSKRRGGGMGHWNNGSLKDLTNGPAKFCEAFGIARAQNGTDLLSDEIFLGEGERIPNSMIGISTRIGIRRAVDKNWRFYVTENCWASGYLTR